MVGSLWLAVVISPTEFQLNDDAASNGATHKHHRNNMTYRSRRWIALYISLVMMAVGWLGGHAFDSLSSRFPPSGVRNSMDGTFDLESFICILIFYTGMSLCVISCLWILVTAFFRILKR